VHARAGGARRVWWAEAKWWRFQAGRALPQM
jgi:hypothetical protein